MKAWSDIIQRLNDTDLSGAIVANYQLLGTICFEMGEKAAHHVD